MDDTTTCSAALPAATDATHLLVDNDNRATSSDAETQMEDPNAQHSLTSDFAQSSSAVSILCTHLLVYYTLAVAGYSFLVGRWSVIDSLYFATTLCTTIGFGDIAPTDGSGRLFTMFLAMYGIVILGILLGIIGEFMVDQSNRAVQEGRTKVGETIVQLFDENNRVENQNQILTSTEGERRSEQSLWYDIAVLALREAPILSVLALAGLMVGAMEGWSLLDSLYWLVISGTTIGFGDFHPDNSVVKLFCVFFLPLCVAVFGQLLGRIASLYMDRKRRRDEQKFMSRSLTLCDLTTMDSDQDGLVDKAEFLCHMLITLQKVSRDDVDQILDLFRKLDVDNTNSLNKDDIVARYWNESFRRTTSV